MDANAYPYQITEIKKHTDSENIEVKLFHTTGGHKGRHYGVRIRDLDAKENVVVTFCATIEKATEYFNKYIGK